MILPTIRTGTRLSDYYNKFSQGGARALQHGMDIQTAHYRLLPLLPPA
jgi:hypothetical protein